MKTNFLLFHSECVNDNRDSVCHLILIPVNEGIKQTPVDFILNPEAPFDFVMSGISESEVIKAPKYRDGWDKIQKIFDKYPNIICSADGYSARALYATLKRLDIKFNRINYSNAKNIFRRVFDEVSYSFDFLNYKYFNDCIIDTEAEDIATRWADLTIKSLNESPLDNLSDFLSENRIRPGMMSIDDFIPSKCIKVKYDKTFDAESIEVDADNENPFYQKNVVFTGKLEKMPRNTARGLVVAIGGYAPETLTQDTNYLVVGNQDLRVVGESGLSGKMKKAAKYKEKGLDIEIINEKDFLEMINEKDN